MTDKVFEDRMRSNPYQTYVEVEILNADPVKLVDLLYKGAIAAVGRARANLASGNIVARSRAVTKAIEIFTELSTALDHERGGQLSARLAGLYDYMQRRLIDANREQADQPLAEVEQILKTLEEAWSHVKTQSLELPEGVKSLRGGVERGLNLMAPEEYVPVSCAY
jgi:flagellar protein FliS